MSSQPVLGASQAVDTPYPDSPWVVLKFGGRSVSTAENWAIIARLLRERLDEGVRPVVVHSALVGVSNALVAKQQLEETGFKIDLQVVDWATLVQRRNKPELFDVFSTGITFNPEPAYNTGVACGWPGWWCQEDKERWLESLARESEPRKRKAMWEKVQAIFYEDVGRIKFGDYFTFQVTRKDLRGFRNAPFVYFWNAWLVR